MMTPHRRMTQRITEELATVVDQKVKADLKGKRELERRKRYRAHKQKLLADLGLALPH